MLTLTPLLFDIHVRATDSFACVVTIVDDAGAPIDLQIYTYELTSELVGVTFTPTPDAGGRILVDVPAAVTAINGKFVYAFVLVLGLERQTILAGAIRVQEHYRTQSWAALNNQVYAAGSEIPQALLAGAVGPAGPPSSPDPENCVPVYQLSDFPAPVGDTIPLDPAVTYIIRADIPLGALKLTGAVINLRGEKSIGPYAFSLTSAHADATIDATGVVVALRVNVINIGVGRAIRNLAGPAGIVSGDFSAAVSYANWAVDVDGGGIAAWHDGPLTGYAGGLRCAGAISDVFIRQALFFSIPTAPAYKAFYCTSSLVAGRVMLVNCRWVASQATDRGLYLDPAIGVAAPVRITGGYFEGYTVPIDETGVQKSGAKLLVDSTVGVDDSRMIGTARFTGNGASTTFASLNTFVPIGNGTPGHMLFSQTPADERWTLVGATAAAQVLTYLGLLTATFLLTADLTISKSGSANVCDVQLFVNGAPVAGATVSINVQSSYAFTRIDYAQTLSPGATVQVRIANTASTNAVIVRSCSLSARRVR